MVRVRATGEGMGEDSVEKIRQLVAPKEALNSKEGGKEGALALAEMLTSSTIQAGTVEAVVATMVVVVVTAPLPQRLVGVAVLASLIRNMCLNLNLAAEAPTPLTLES